MRLTRPRFTMRRMMLVVAAMGAFSAILAQYARTADYFQPFMFFVLCLVTAAVGIGAMRRPWTYLAYAVAFAAFLLTSSPTGLVHTDIETMFLPGCVVGWFVGAPAGWILRLRRESTLLPLARYQLVRPPALKPYPFKNVPSKSLP